MDLITMVEQAKRDRAEELHRDRVKAREDEVKYKNCFDEEGRRFVDTIKPHVRAASPTDYRKWLVGYIGSGNRITHNYDYAFPERRFFVARSDFVMMELCGSLAISVIVPKGITIHRDEDGHRGGLGHCELYFMDGFKTVNGFVPCYNRVL